MTRQVTSDNARIGRRCAEALEKLQTSGYPCRGDLPFRAHAACSHVRYGSKLERHAASVLKQFTKACPSHGFDGPKRRRRRR